jgi:gluconokinase
VTLPNFIAMGVSGSGKTTFGRALAERLGAPFCEGDDLHPAANRAKMTSGTPLTDTDRWSWLDSIGAWLHAQAERGGFGVASCSALKAIYRDRLRTASPELVCILLSVDRDRLNARLTTRQGHFMPASLLDSQLATLEPPLPREDILVVDGTRPVEELVGSVVELLRKRGHPIR